MASAALLFFLFATSIFFVVSSHAAANPIGVNYGTVADNLPPPAQVVKLLQSTTIGKMKLYNADPNILRAFANTGIQFIVGIANGDVASLTNLNVARQWVQNNVAAYMPATEIIAIAVGNEVLATKDKVLISQLMRAMVNLHAALVSEGLDSKVKVSSPHSLGILHNSVPPSAAIFRTGLTKAVLLPMLEFLSKTGAPFMANPYPFFGYLGDPAPDALDYAIFTSSVGYTDPRTHLHYTNMFDAQMDAIYSAIAALGFKDIDVVVTETGWPSLGDPTEKGVSLENAQTYNNNLIKHILSNQGTPLRPKKQIDTYIFALFNEDLKPGPTSERNYGLFKPDLTPVYNTLVVSKNQSPSNAAPNTGAPKGGAPARGTQKWCVAKPGTGSAQLLSDLNYACGEGGADCGEIQANRACYLPNSLDAHTSYAMNSYYQKQGRNDWDCFFNNSGMIVYKNPSYGSCVYPST